MPALTSEISLGWQKLKLEIDTRQAQMGTLFRLWLVCQEWDIGETRRNTSIGTSFRHDNKSYLFNSSVILLILVRYEVDFIDNIFQASTGTLPIMRRVLPEALTHGLFRQITQFF